MDTAIIVVRAEHLSAVRAYLSENLPVQSEPCLLHGSNGPVAFVNLEPALNADIDQDDIDELQKRLTSDDLLAILVDVRVRNVGAKEVRTFVVALLSQFHGYAADDLLEYWWTRDEILGASGAGTKPFWPHETVAQRMQ
jgi:hypothetical protein